MSTLADEMIQLLEPPSEHPKVNKQLYMNSDLAGSAIEKELAESSNKLYNTRLPNLAIIHEKPEHRLIAFFKAQGRTNREVAKLLDYTEPWVSQITRQPWFQRRLMDALDAGNDRVQEFLGTQLEPTILQVVHLRDHAQSENVQLGACIHLLDRFLGKPVVKMETKFEDVTKREQKVLDLDNEMKLLDEEEERIKETLREGRGAPTSASTTEVVEPSPNHVPALNPEAVNGH